MRWNNGERGGKLISFSPPPPLSPPPPPPPPPPPASSLRQSRVNAPSFPSMMMVQNLGDQKDGDFFLGGGELRALLCVTSLDDDGLLLWKQLFAI